MGIVVIGAVFVDIKGYSFTTYVPNGRNAGSIKQVHGGVGRNVAEDLANMELRPTFISLVDESGIGEDVIKRLNAHKVNTQYIEKRENGLGTWLALFDKSGDVVGSISARPDLTAIYDIIEEHGDEIFSTCDSIVVEIDLGWKILKRIYEFADKYHKDVYAVISNMSIAVERRDLLCKCGCLVCNEQEASVFFSEEYEHFTPEEMLEVLPAKVKNAKMRKMVVTMGSQGAVYADNEGNCGIVPALDVDVVDTTGAGDSFCAGVAAGLTYGKSLKEACEIGSRLAASVIATKVSVCPRFKPEEFGIEF